MISEARRVLRCNAETTCRRRIPAVVAYRPKPRFLIRDDPIPAYYGNGNGSEEDEEIPRVRWSRRVRIRIYVHHMHVLISCGGCAILQGKKIASGVNTNNGLDGSDSDAPQLPEFGIYDVPSGM